ncbi:lipoprotein-releasing ABC transporter permease subunit [Vitreimonas flagellata]|uniref:lipoprotein-releasing ABC transporter permease subunit n=1 Tax=Vitreimonas flagellata TaxID=2560861 RepID=UPI0010750329|nr:lipoprotein-releasing ABC transporter permease subunit [Vitreimonas flagellata]
MSGNSQPFGLFERMLAGRYLRAKRQHGGVALISVISVVAITLAVFALIVTMSVMNGFRETLLSRILGVNGHVYIDVRNMPGSEIDRLSALVRESAEVTHVTPIINAQALATSEGLASGVIVRGIPREELAQLPIVMDSIRPGGGLENFQGVEAPSILVGDRLAAALGVTENMAITLISPQGSATPFGLTPRRKAFLVGGVFSVGMAEFDSALIYMPLEQAQVMFGKGDGADELEIRVQDPDRTLQVMMDLRARLGPDAFIYDWRAKSQGLSDALVVERNVMRLILMILVAIAALNVITGLIMLVKNKGRDIAILRTIGATRGAIMRVFFMASASLGVLGLSLGLLLGIGFCMNIEFIQNTIQSLTGFDLFPGTVYSLETLPARVEWGEVAFISVFTIGVTFASTLITSWWASRFDPVEALRYE